MPWLAAGLVHKQAQARRLLHTRWTPNPPIQPNPNPARVHWPPSAVASFYVKAAFSPDGSHILSGSTDRKAYIWQASPCSGDDTAGWRAHVHIGRAPSLHAAGIPRLGASLCWIYQWPAALHASPDRRSAGPWHHWVLLKRQSRLCSHKAA